MMKMARLPYSALGTTLAIEETMKDVDTKVLNLLEHWIEGALEMSESFSSKTEHMVGYENALKSVQEYIDRTRKQLTEGR